MILPISDRTILRDTIVDELTNRKNTDAVRLKDYDVVTNYATVEECRRAVTYCVVVADESPTPATTLATNFALTAILVIYVRDETDVRAMLDAAIEDAYSAVLAVQSKTREANWMLRLDDLTTDDGTTAAKPHAQAVQRWIATHRRAAVAA